MMTRRLLVWPAQSAGIRRQGARLLLGALRAWKVGLTWTATRVQFARRVMLVATQRETRGDRRPASNVLRGRQTLTATHHQCAMFAATGHMLVLGPTGQGPALRVQQARRTPTAALRRRVLLVQSEPMQVQARLAVERAFSAEQGRPMATRILPRLVLDVLLGSMLQQEQRRV